MEFKKKSLYIPMFPNQWTPIKLYELAEWINGKAFKKDDYNITGLPVIKIAELNTGLSSNTKYSINNDVKFYIKKGDILFAWSGNPDTSIDTHKFKEKEGYLNQHIFKVLPNDNKIESDFLYYILKYLKPFFKEIARNKQTTGLGHVTISDLKKIQVRIPSKNIQKEIADIFIILDSKIEINNKIISNLESQAQAIFKSWFVDFEPFQDGDFVESELGMIPEGWEVKELGEVADFSNGYSFKSKDLLEEKKSKNDYKVFKQADIKVGGGINPNNTKSWIDSEFIKKNKLSRFIIQSGDLMMCMTDMKNNVRLLGNTALVYQPDEYILNQRVGRLRSKQKEIKPSFLYYLTNNSVFLNDLRGRANTGVQVNLSTSEIKRSKVILPTCDIIKRFCDYSESITKSINSLNNQNTKLAELRDALLPKLMAGEIDVSNIKIEGEEVKNE